MEYSGGGGTVSVVNTADGTSKRQRSLRTAPSRDALAGARGGRAIGGRRARGDPPADRGAQVTSAGSVHSLVASARPRIRFSPERRLALLVAVSSLLWLLPGRPAAAGRRHPAPPRRP